MPHCPACHVEVPGGSRFCGSCGAALSASDTPTQTAVFGEEGRPAETPTRNSLGGGSTPVGVGRLSTSDTFTEARFLPGVMIGNRYRIIGLLGQGGMGEVYRADDLTLGQSVALKFLPEALARDPGRLQRFLNEVRVARQVSHPNVCRMYDIGEYEGQHYLSMEYVDGEDLASLLRRVGRFSDDKAVQIARQICAGLSAAHAKGIVHRDLKPANVMIDGEGKVRITDFGLAGLADAFQGAEIRVGTPAYMSPEQITGKEVTLRSDIYSLGLVLYELFTGKAAFDAPTLAELSRQQQETMPSSPSAVVANFEPAVERVILRCLEKDPAQRPPSVTAVAAALPGADPLTAALEAGETPSPEMVAAAGESGGLRPAVGLAMLALLLLGVGALVVLLPRASLPQQFPMTKPPQVLEQEARTLIQALGYTDPPADRAHGFATDTDYFVHVRQNDSSPGRWQGLDRVRPSPLVYWYRQSPRPLMAARAAGSASYANPPMSISGMVRLQSDTEGRLLDFLAVPLQTAELPDPTVEPDWTPLLQAAGLDRAGLTPTRPAWNPLVDCDVRRAWQGTYAEQPDVSVRVEAGSFGGRPVYFTVIAPWTPPGRVAQASQTPKARRVINVSLIVVLLLILVGALLLARRNIKAGRGDRRGAFRMAAYVFLLIIGAWALGAHHIASLAELAVLANAIQSALLVGALVWVLYLALEPYVRKLWPQTMISWSRLVAGRIKDPLVGRDLLIGALAGVLVDVAAIVGHLAPGWVGRPLPAPITDPVGVLAAPRQLGRILLTLQPGAMISAIGVFFVVFLLRLILRRDWLAFGGAFLFFAVITIVQLPELTLVGLILSVTVWGILIFVFMRFGLLAACFTMIYANLIQALPLTAGFSAWYAGRAWVGLAIAAAVAAYGFYVSLAGRKLFGDPLADL